ncbi:cupin domain-containing protein [Trinickia sp. LjRoot230]|uniref:cupin domain-containing protein n=1 Tax=Trinickia sp. LjRoot230 TaxID=3342288 RepID=UPI003ECC2897
MDHEIDEDDDIVLLSTAGRNDAHAEAGAPGEAFSYQAAAGYMKRPGSLFMYMAVIAPGETIPPHLHPAGTETILYVLSGNVEHRYGRAMQKSMLNQPGDFVYIPGNVPHQPVNLSATEPVKAIVACNFDLNVKTNSIPYANSGLG